MQTDNSPQKKTKQTGLFGRTPKALPKEVVAQGSQDPTHEGEDIDITAPAGGAVEVLPQGMDDDDEVDLELFRKAKAMPKFVPWVEKYRPGKIEEISHQAEVVNALKVSVRTGHVPHLLMFGPPGTGKTSTVLALAIELFGRSNYRSRILELNASDERGIRVVREKIKKFAQKKIKRDLMDGNRRVPPIQLIILDEADSMTIEAQAALRRIIEEYSTTTRFCIICNYISKIIDPLASRCVKFRFGLISAESQLDRLRKICKTENIQYENTKVLDELIAISEGDLRRSINTLQTCSSFIRGNKAKEIPDRVLTSLDIERISGIVPNPIVAEIYVKIRQSQGYSDIQLLAQNLILEGYDVQQLNIRMMDFFIMLPNSNVNDLHKAKISEVIADTDFKMIQGGDEELNLLQTLSMIALIINS